LQTTKLSTFNAVLISRKAAIFSTLTNITKPSYIKKQKS